ncbi:stage II sporulation protein D [Clostridium sp. BJN0001]|uniref:stage II sporulation protein D n=1 Tax=Clostridium sp. BJN0001 TaxID=2930219 RepID=UPI001FD595C0|nr:stage II sporulation protein D [Clostridium sp. BJN0001]
MTNGDFNNKYLIKTIIIITGIIIIVLTLGSIFTVSKYKINIFNLDDSSVIHDSEDITFPKNQKVKLYDSKNGKVLNIDLEEYVMGVVCAEMPAEFNEEALKAQAVAARTYYMSKRKTKCTVAKKYGGEICATAHCQAYMSKEERMSLWSKKKADEYWDKIKDAVSETEGEILTYDNKLVEYPEYFAISPGKTEDCADVFSFNVPYLKSEESKGEEIAPKYSSEKSISMDEFINTIKSKYPSCNINRSNFKDIVKICDFTGSGAVKNMLIGNEKIKGSKFRSLFSLNSTDFKLEYTSDKVNVYCTGYGHNVGMSQWGANVLAKKGYSYEEILKHYYNGVDIDKIIKK